LVSYDIWEVGVGHIHGKQKLVINFHDHYSGLNKPYLLAHYDDAPKAMDLYLSFCNSHHVTCRRMHTDNGTTLCSAEMRTKLASKSIHLTTIAPHCPRQNGVCERQWRTLAADTRRLLAQARMPRSFWWYAMRHSAMVAALVPLSAAKHECAWSRFTSKAKPSCSWVRVWGCLAYTKLYNPVTKVHDQSLRTIYLGQSPDQPGDVCYDPAHNRIHVSPNNNFCRDLIPWTHHVIQR
jgi:Integrase core domain.